MPSDNKKAKAAAKKLGQKKRQNNTKKDEEIAVTETNKLTNGHLEDGKKEENGKETTKIGLSKHDKDAEFEGSEDEDEARTASIVSEIESLNLCSEHVAQHRSVTGVLTSQRDGRDVHFTNLCITFHGQEILVDTALELNNGRRYGLIGMNGCGKSSLFAVLSNNELPIPSHIDHYLLQREMAPSDKTALESVMEADEERTRLEKEAEELAVRGDDEVAHDRLIEVYERLDDLDAERAEKRAAEILFGLGFTREMQHKAVKHFSGGWRMRIALARALFVKPALLMLDEPTNHLDLQACVWLERELAAYSRILVIISHSEDFLNGVCTNIIHMQHKKLVYYGGNYDQYMQTRAELEENQMKKYRWEQDQMAHMKDYIARFGHGSRKLARQAQSKEKTLKKMVDGGLTQRVVAEKTLTFGFPSCGEIPPPVIQIQNVSFRYSENKPLIYDNIDFGIDLDTRVALVGPNGAGKSTLLKLIAGELESTDGLVRRHSHCRIGRYHQHLAEILDLGATALDWMLRQFPDVKERDDMRKRLGRYGLTGAQQVCPIRALSDGQRCRIIFAWLAETSPHMLLLDEPTNHLDLNAVIWLDNYLQRWKKTLLVVSHDQSFLNNVCTDIIHVSRKKLDYYRGNYSMYSEMVHQKLEQDRKQYEQQQKELKALKKKGQSKKAAEKKQKDKLSKKEAKSKRAEEEIEDSGPIELLEKPKEYQVKFDFPNPPILNGSILSLTNVSFSYGSCQSALFDNLDFGVDMTSRISIVGPNGVGKSTFLKLLTGEIEPTKGERSINHRVKLGKYNQHSGDQLNMKETPVDYLRRLFNLQEQEARQNLGRFGLESHAHKILNSSLSGGQRARVAFAELALAKPDLLILDEPTNNLDLESIEALCVAIERFTGGVVMVTHDERLIRQTKCSLWVVENRSIAEVDGDFDDYRKEVLEALNEEISNPSVVAAAAGVLD